MNILVVYDSIFGNTAQIATAIGEALKESNEVKLATVQDAKSLDLSAIDLLIVGSPTRGFRPTPQISEYVEGLSKGHAGKAAAAFDTRIELETIHPAPLRWVVDAGGYAADRIAALLERHGFAMTGGRAGFFVGGTEGPLNDGELERAKAWARSLTLRAAAA